MSNDLEELKEVFWINVALAGLLLILFSPFIWYALTADIYIYNPQTMKEDMPCTFGFRLLLACIWVAPAVFMIVVGPIAVMAVPNVADKAIRFLFR